MESVLLELDRGYDKRRYYLKVEMVYVYPRIIAATLRGILMLVNTNCEHKVTCFAYSRIENVRDIIMLLLLRCHNKFGVYAGTTGYNGRLHPDFQSFTHLLNLFFDVRDALFAYVVPFQHTSKE